MLDYSFHRLAQDEFEDAALFYEGRSSNLGMAFVDSVSSAITIIRQYPEIGTPHDSGTRRFGIDTFPYSVVYRLDQEVVRVIAVAAHARRPGYWKRRE